MRVGKNKFNQNLIKDLASHGIYKQYLCFVQCVLLPAPAPDQDELDVVLAPARDELDTVLAPAACQDELDKVLAKTTNSNKTMIITALNGAWVEPNTMIDLFLESYRVREETPKLLSNLLIVALDAKAHKCCLKIHAHCYTLKITRLCFLCREGVHEQRFLENDVQEAWLLGRHFETLLQFCFLIKSVFF